MTGVTRTQISANSATFRSRRNKPRRPLRDLSLCVWCCCDVIRTPLDLILPPKRNALPDHSGSEKAVQRLCRRWAGGYGYGAVRIGLWGAVLDGAVQGGRGALRLFFQTFLNTLDHFLRAHRFGDERMAADDAFFFFPHCGG